MRSEPNLSTHRTNRCGVTRKVIFRSERSALDRGGEILEAGARGARHFRAYACQYCGGYHISSK